MGAYREAQQNHIWKMITEQVSSPPADVALWGDSILQQVEGVVWPDSFFNKKMRFSTGAFLI